MTAHVDPELWTMLEGDPEARLQAIVIADADLDALLAELPEDVEIEHRYRLINSISVTARAGTLRELMQLPRVKSIESVRPVTAFS